MNRFLFDEFTDLLEFSSWPVYKAQSYKKSSNGEVSKETIDSRVEWFKKQSFEKMSSTIEDLETLLNQFKDIRKTKISKEIEEAEEKLKKLRSL